MHLPYKHLFNLFQTKEINTFDDNLNLIAQRWTKSFYVSSHPEYSTPIVLNDTPVVHRQVIRLSSEIAKHKIAARVLKETSNLMSTLPQDQFNHYINLIQNI